MPRTTDPVALNQWYAVASLGDLARAEQTRLLGQPITVGPGAQVRADGWALPVLRRYGCLWTTLGTPARDLFDIAEDREADRRFVPCGWVTLRTSGLRVVENFLDMAHFPFVHTDILGAEPHTAVPQYLTEIRRDVDEVWATNCTFFQSRIAATESAGAFVHLTFRVPAPFMVMLYRVCPSATDRLDAIALFIQPLEPDLCRAQPVMWLVDDQSTQQALLRFEQVIFLQDRIIVENQRPLLLPLEPRSEIPTRADASSVAYRRWLKEKGLVFGTTAGGGVMQVWQPATLDQAQAMLARPGAQGVAGGTALQLEWARGRPRPAALVVLAGLLPVGVTQDGPAWRIGAATTLDAIGQAGIPLLSAAVQDVAAPGVRRLATIGGTIGWGAGCLIPALLVAGARVQTTRGAQALADWLAAPAGVILSVDLTIPPGVPGYWRKVGLRAAFSPAVIVVAALGGALAVGGGPVRPSRLPAAEAAAPADLHRVLMAEIAAPDCPWRTGAYRRRVAANLLAGARLAGGAAGSAARAGRGGDTRPDTRPVALAGALRPGGPRWHQRPDIAAKIAGDVGFLTDHRAPGLLVGRILRAAHPHARIVSVDPARAVALPGVRAVVTHRDVPGLNAFGIMRQDQPALCHDRVRYLGDAVAAVAAIDAATAEAALALIEVTYAPLPVVASAAAALDAAAPALHPTGNLAVDLGLTRGDVDGALAGAAHVSAETYVTPRQMHGFLETEGGYAVPQPDGGLLVAVGGQHGARDRQQLARILNLPEDRLRIVTSPTGGAFGGKDELTVQAPLALLALKAGAPVRLHLSRAESVLAGTKSPPMQIRMRTACDAQGRLVAQEVDLLADAGAYASLSPAVVETALEHAAGPYAIAHVRTRGRLAHTNNGTCGAFRGFGANQMTYALECQIDRLAVACGLSPVEMRRRNLRAPADPGFLGQVIAPSDRLAPMLAAAATSPLWPAAPGDDDGRRTGSGTSADASLVGREWIGTGMALHWQGTGLGTLPQDSASGTLRLAPDGRIEVLCGLDEMGQGLLTGLQAAVADRLGVARADVRPVVGDTGATPDSGSTTAARGGHVVWRLAELAAPGFARDLVAAGCRMLGLPDGALVLCPGGLALPGSNSAVPVLGLAQVARDSRPAVTVAFDFPKADYTAGNARFIFASGATLARVAVDPDTGQARVLDLHLHTAAGPVIDLAAYLGQVEGAAVQALGFALTEDMRIVAGRPQSGNLDSYLMPTMADRPLRLQVTADETLDPGDPYGPRGVGELGIGAVAPAIANAIAAATGHWPATAPFAPVGLPA